MYLIHKLALDALDAASEDHVIDTADLPFMGTDDPNFKEFTDCTPGIQDFKKIVSSSVLKFDPDST